MELYSKEELLKELKKEYSCGGECDHCPEVLDAGSCAVLRCVRRIIDNVTPVKAFTKEDIAGAYNEGYMCGNKEAEKARPQGEWGKWVISEIWCPNCLEYFQTYCYSTEELKKCPNCGSDMHKGDVMSEEEKE